VVYKITPECENYILNRFEEKTIDDIPENDLDLLNELFDDITLVEPDSVVLNYECCHSCRDGSSYKFPNPNITFRLTKFMIDRSSMVMFTHFSIMSLVNSWDSTLLGTAPFVSIGNGSGNLVLHFSPAVINACPSAQLQRVGELCEKGTCSVNGYTCYSVDQSKIGIHQDYTIEVLTVITNQVGTINSSLDNNVKWSIDGHSGIPCHTILRYPSGGILLASNAHWLDLSNLDVSAEKMLQLAEQTYSSVELETMKSDIMSKTGEERKKEVSKYAKKYVTESVPCKYSDKKKSKK